MDSMVVSIIIVSCSAALWWFITTKMEMRYTKVRVLGLEIDRAIFVNKFNRRRAVD